MRTAEDTAALLFRFTSSSVYVDVVFFEHFAGFADTAEFMRLSRIVVDCLYKSAERDDGSMKYPRMCVSVVGFCRKLYRRDTTSIPHLPHLLVMASLTPDTQVSWSDIATALSPLTFRVFHKLGRRHRAVGTCRMRVQVYVFFHIIPYRMSKDRGRGLKYSKSLHRLQCSIRQSALCGRISSRLRNTEYNRTQTPSTSSRVSFSVQ